MAAAHAIFLSTDNLLCINTSPFGNFLPGRRFARALPVILRRGFPSPVILRSFAPKNLSDHAPETGGKILRFAQNDRGIVILRRGFPPSVILRSFAPKNLSDHAPEIGEKILRFAQNDKETVILRAAFPLPVILRSFAPKNLSDHAPETGEKILRFAQNDNEGGAQNDGGREKRFFASLRMTRGVGCGMTGDRRKDSSLRSE